jgi:hypothetical protein
LHRQNIDPRKDGCRGSQQGTRAIYRFSNVEFAFLHSLGQHRSFNDSPDLNFWKMLGLIAMRVMRFSMRGSTLILGVAFSSFAIAGDAEKGAANCEQLEIQAIKLGGAKKLQEAAKLYDRVLAECPANPGTMTSRGVLYAVMGETAKAEVIINEAIVLAESTGNQCRADMSRAELSTIKGGPRLDSLPKTCKRSGR